MPKYTALVTRICRVHHNTLEWLPTFLVPQWLSAKAVEGRLPGFFVQSTTCILLFLGAAVGVFRQF
jgi:hypothetical protein